MNWELVAFHLMRGGLLIAGLIAIGLFVAPKFDTQPDRKFKIGRR